MQKDKVELLVKEIVLANGLELIEYKVFEQGKTIVVRCEVDYPRGGVSIDVCGKVNKEIVSRVEAEGLLKDDFTIEVNSPGITKKLKTASDFTRRMNREVEIFFRTGNERADVSGEIVKVDQQTIILKTNDEEIKVDINEIKYGKEKIKF
ncbi:MAG: hypothetical protein PHP69_01795 [Candidatus Omnitrophica bacterium]|nr:hypothetical protein [Candidatus Omnitrophota bacterium]